MEKRENLKKKKYGQFYTIFNPFKNSLFIEWYNKIPDKLKKEALEPFAGSNNILNLINEVKEISPPKKWKCYDIAPNNTKENKSINYIVEKRDTIKDFPKGYHLVVTNPPYLAKNKATLMNIEFDKNYEDIYLKCLDIMLKNVEYIAAIIPESFITSDKYRERLYGVVSLEMKMFDDTEVPVCLAMFNKDNVNETKVYKNDKFIGTIQELKKYNFFNNYKEIDLKFNDNYGNIGFIAIDNTKENSIKFVDDSEISTEIKVSSRAITKISGIEFKDNIQKENFINKLNENIENYRNLTQDVFLTSFKGLRKDLKYRRRMDYKTARNIINKVYKEFDWR